MPTYSVRWTIDIFDAEGPDHAAVKALIMHRDPDSIATYFEVSSAEDAQVVGLNADTSSAAYRDALHEIERRSAARYMYSAITGRRMPSTVTVGEVIEELASHIDEDNATFRKPKVQPTTISFVLLSDLLPNEPERREWLWQNTFKSESDLNLVKLGRIFTAAERKELQRTFDGLTSETWVDVEYFPDV